MAGSFTDLVTLFGKRASRVATAVAAGEAAWPIIKNARSWAKEKFQYTVKVQGSAGTADLFDDLQEWILELLPPKEQTALVAYGAWGHWYSDKDEPHKLLIGYDGTRKRTVNIDGHRITISLSEADRDKEKSAEICFTASTLAGRDAILDRIRDVLKQGPARPFFKVLDQYGTGWDRATEIPARSLDSIILPEGQLDRITEDIRSFLDSEDLYARRSIPWHRAHLYSGPPGTGKTSIAKAVADHFELNVHYLPLADVEKDTKLVQAVMEVKAHSLLLIEDIDVFSAATQRTEECKKSTLSALLNVLDGIATPHGLITIMTTNHPEVLDDALLRPGRVDLREHLGLFGPREIDRLVSHWYDKPVQLHLPPGTLLAPAAITEICKRHDHPDDVMMELMADIPLLSAA